MDKIALRITEDGSHTLYLEGLDETYHSKHGAIQEAMHVFIDAGLNQLNHFDEAFVLFFDSARLHRKYPLSLRQVTDTG